MTTLLIVTTLVVKNVGLLMMSFGTQNVVATLVFGIFIENLMVPQLLVW